MAPSAAPHYAPDQPPVRRPRPLDRRGKRIGARPKALVVKPCQTTALRRRRMRRRQRRSFNIAIELRQKSRSNVVVG